MKKLIQSNFKTTASLTVKYILLHIAGNGIRILLKRKVESMSLHGMLLAVCLLILGMNAQAQFPVIAGTNTSVRTTQTSGNHIISLPSGIESGDLILIFWADGTETGTDPSLPGGYILLDSYETESSYFAIWYRIADGTEGATVSTTNSFGERSAHITYRIQKGTYTGVPIFERANGSSSSPNPPTLSPSWGSQNYLWIASAHANESSDVSSYPTNYGDELMVRTSGGTSSNDEHAQMATAHRFFETDSQNPGSFSFSQTVTWAAYTVAILPDLFNSPTNKLFMRNTAEGQSGTGANVTALSENQGSCTSITTDSYSGTDLTTERYAFTIDVDNLTESIASDIFLYSVNITGISSSNTQYRFRMQRRNAAGVVQESTAYSETFAGDNTGIRFGLLEFPSSQSWNTGDRLVFQVFVARTSSGSSGRTITISTCDAGSFIQYGFNPCDVTAFNVTGSGQYCEEASVGLDDSEIGVAYELYLDGSPTGNTQAGTGSALSFDDITIEGSYTIIGTHDADNCDVSMSGGADITIVIPPAATGVEICLGGSGQLEVTENCNEEVVEIFTSNGTFTPPDGVTHVNVFIVAGGGGGGSRRGGAGGGGAGGVIMVENVAVTDPSYAIVVGAGGEGGTTSSAQQGSDGGNSSAFGFTAIGGGGGGALNSSTTGINGRNGGSGGGGGLNGGSGTTVGTGGQGTVDQGHNGGTGVFSSYTNAAGGGGGGAGSTGGNAANSTTPGAGGSGIIFNLTEYARGGIGGVSGSTIGIDADANTGNGGGGSNSDGSPDLRGGDGGTGIVIISYSYQIEWYNDASGGAPVFIGNPFDPVDEGLVDNESPGTSTFWAACSSAPDCRTSVDFVIHEPPTFTLDYDDISCFNAGDGEIRIAATGGTTPYEYQYSTDDGDSWTAWTKFDTGDDNATETAITNILPGTYQIEIRDANGCVQTTCTTP